MELRSKLTSASVEKVQQQMVVKRPIVAKAASKDPDKVVPLYQKVDTK
jgi:hypothetical protein